ncbi:MAG TPA: LysM peptidoglycan-binding domain-containing protein [Chloroflexi bacterium]|nr:LysM peptidoglycan-binding domain-containing protein [Chloroflexota bacterium]
MRSRTYLFFCLFALFLAGFSSRSMAPNQLHLDENEDPTYIVQPGDTLATIAAEFGVPLADLISVNDIQNPNLIPIGTELILPGMQGISGVLTTINLPIGATLHNLSIEYQVAPDVLAKVNKIASPSQMYQSARFIVPLQEDRQMYEIFTDTSSALTLLEQSALHNTNVWQIAKDNRQNNTWSFLPNRPLFRRTTAEAQSPLLSDIVRSLNITPDALRQGNIMTIEVVTTQEADLQGFFQGRELHFYESGANTYTAHQGLNAIHPVGLNEFILQITPSDGKMFAIEQYLPSYATAFGVLNLTVDNATLDIPAMRSEDESIGNIISQITEEKYWSLPFLCPLEAPICVRDWYGTNRNYNNGTFFNFHTGVDYGVCANLNIHAPADGVVVIAQEFTVRGLATYIDHGYGVYSAFYHQAQSYVKVGDFVKAGDLIGEIGSTGRSTGPHLHYELIVNGVQVNPYNWLSSDCQ